MKDIANNPTVLKSDLDKSSAVDKQAQAWADLERIVYLAISSYSNYDGGTDTILGVYSTEDRAIARLKTEWICEHSKLLSDFIDAGMGDYIVDDSTWLCIKSQIVDK